MKYYENRNEMLKATVPDGSVGVEVGVQHGDLSRVILGNTDVRLLHLVDTWRHVEGNSGYCLDPANVSQENQEIRYKGVLSRLWAEIADGRVEVHRVPSQEAASWFDDDSLDWVYIDADHTFQACLEDLEAWSHTIRPGGVIYLHDYCVNGKTIFMGFGVYDAVSEFMDSGNSYGFVMESVTLDEWPTLMLRKSTN